MAVGTVAGRVGALREAWLGAVACVGTGRWAVFVIWLLEDPIGLTHSDQGSLPLNQGPVEVLTCIAPRAPLLFPLGVVCVCWASRVSLPRLGSIASASIPILPGRTKVLTVGLMAQATIHVQNGEV